MAPPEDKGPRIEKAHIGTMGWSYGFWVGSLYPEGTKPTEFLEEYAKHFDSVEVDNTFYRIPSANTTRAWKEQAPEDFLFSAKFPRVITHVKMLRDCEKEVEIFTSRMSLLKNKLGALLLQFPRQFGSKHFSLLQQFLPTLPKGFRYAVEVRSKSLHTEKLRSLLGDNGVALVLVDPPVTQEQITADFAYIRWEGDREKVNGTLGRVEVDRTEEIRNWAAQLEKLLSRNVEVFGYFSKYYSGFPPSDAEQILNQLN